MSMSLMTLAMKAKVGNPLRKLVLIKLADNANDNGECWPSYQYIADDCEIDRSTVRKHIKALEQAGFLKIENRKGPKGNTSNLYVLCLHPVGSNSTPIGPESTPPVGPESTRTYHSSEPVNEPRERDARDENETWVLEEGNSYLIATGSSETQAPRLINEWLKAYPAKQVRDAIAQAQICGAGSPPAYIAKVLRNGPRSNLQQFPIDRVKSKQEASRAAQEEIRARRARLREEG